MDESDADIIERVLAGDRQRFGVLVERHGKSLLAYISRRVSEREEARELFQDAVVCAFEGLAQLRDASALRAWWIGIASNMVRKQRRRLAPEALGALEHDLPAPQPPDRLEREESSARIARAIAELPGRQREVFELRALHELAHEEIGRLLEISADSSRANYYQAARKLRSQLGGELP